MQKKEATTTTTAKAKKPSNSSALHTLLIPSTVEAAALSYLQPYQQWNPETLE